MWSSLSSMLCTCCHEHSPAVLLGGMVLALIGIRAVLKLTLS